MVAWFKNTPFANTAYLNNQRVSITVIKKNTKIKPMMILDFVC